MSDFLQVIVTREGAGNPVALQTWHDEEIPLTFEEGEVEWPARSREPHTVQVWGTLPFEWYFAIPGEPEPAVKWRCDQTPLFNTGEVSSNPSIVKVSTESPGGCGRLFVRALLEDSNSEFV